MFPVRSGIAIPDRTVARKRDNFAVSHQDCADRDLCGQRRSPALFQGQLHEFRVFVHRSARG